MEIELIEDENGKMKIRIPDLTMVNLINENIWQQKGVEVAAYATEHPYLSQPVLLVKSKNPKKSILDACQQIVDDVSSLKKQFISQEK